MSEANDRADLITQLQYIDTITGGDVAKRAAAALTEAQERWDRHERVNTDLHRVCFELQQKLTELGTAFRDYKIVHPEGTP